MKTLFAVSIALLGASFANAQTANNGYTTVFTMLLGKNPVNLYHGIPPSYGVMVTACDQRADVVSFQVHLVGSGDGFSVDQKQVMGGEKNQAGCLTTWFANTGKLTKISVHVDPVAAKINESVDVDE